MPTVHPGSAPFTALRCRSFPALAEFSDFVRSLTLRRPGGRAPTNRQLVDALGCPHPREGTPGGGLADVGIPAPDAEALTVAQSAVESTEPGMVLGSPTCMSRSKCAANRRIANRRRLM